jgi:hypothetical protein
MNNVLQMTKLITLDNIVAEDSITPQAIAHLELLIKERQILFNF